MIHYHGSPVGGTRQMAVQFWRGRHGLASFAAPEEISIIAEECQSFVLDNGAFSEWKRGQPMDVPGYIAWCREWGILPWCDWCLIPDVIEGTEADNDALLRDWPDDLRGVPVYHLHESLDRAERLSHEWPTVALGSSGEWPDPGTDSWWDRMADVLAVMCDDGVPRCRLHGLRMLDPAIFHCLPLASADSTNVARNAASKAAKWGVPHIVGAESMAGRIEAHNAATRWSRHRQVLIPFALSNTEEPTE